MYTQCMLNQNNKNNMNILSDLLTDVFETYFGADYFINDWERLREFLNHPNFPSRAAEFKRDLANAMKNKEITPKVLEHLTDIDYEAQEEVDEFLINEIWKPLYGDEPVKN
jgi:hypothetical protein